MCIMLIYIYIYIIIYIYVCDTYSDLDLQGKDAASTASKSSPVSGPKELAKAQAPEMDLPNVSCRGVDVFQDIKDGMN